MHLEQQRRDSQPLMENNPLTLVYMYIVHDVCMGVIKLCCFHCLACYRLKYCGS